MNNNKYLESSTDGPNPTRALDRQKFSRSPVKWALLFVAVSSLIQSGAWISHSEANVVGIGSQNFNTNTSGLDFVTVQSAQTLEPGIFNAGIFLNYAVNTLPYLESTPQGRTNFSDLLFGMDLNLGVGLMNRWDVGVSVPFILNQQVRGDTAGTHGQFSKSGNTEIRFNTKYRLIKTPRFGLAAVGTVNFDRVKGNPYTGDGAGPGVSFELAADYRLGDFLLGLNLGHRWTNSGTQVNGSFIQPIRNQILYSAAGNYLIPGVDTKIVAEVFGSLPARDVNADLNRSATSLELLVGLKHDLTHNIAGHAGAGTELIHGNSSPDWRVYTGINIAFGPVFETTDEPAFVPPPVVDQKQTFVVSGLEFEFDSDQMTEESTKKIDSVAQAISGQQKEAQIEVFGHTDNLGAAAYNLQLSQKRAEKVREILIQNHQFDASRITAIGRGEEEPIADNGNFQGRQKNRRVEIVVTLP